ncbi:MAG TPA: DUF721 domain-containing protein [bacterium]|jgi:predicted nucleic acid-binding Zn ribbon protein|nr:DUF721 domain-containing protein [bacterium]
MVRDDNQHISKGLAQLIHQLGLEQRLKQQRVIEEWPQLVGEKIGKISRPDHLQEGVLYVRVASMTWRTELLFQKQAILAKIGSALGEGLVKDIRFI